MPQGDEARLPNLAGTWRRLDGEPCTGSYPRAVTFSQSTYRGTRGPEQGFVVWDAGIYRTEHSRGTRSLILSTATDELVTYRIGHASAQRFSVVDPAGCDITYVRVPDDADPPT